MPISCPGGKDPKFRFTKKDHRRLAICPGGKVIENVKFKKDKKTGKLVKAAKQAKSLGK